MKTPSIRYIKAKKNPDWIVSDKFWIEPENAPSHRVQIAIDTAKLLAKIHDPDKPDQDVFDVFTAPTLFRLKKEAKAKVLAMGVEL